MKYGTKIEEEQRPCKTRVYELEDLLHEVAKIDFSVYAMICATHTGRLKTLWASSLVLFCGAMPGMFLEYGPQKRYINLYEKDFNSFHLHYGHPSFGLAG